MSKIEELINELCPDGVDFFDLSQVCERIFAGGTPSTSRQEYYDGLIPWIRSGEIDFNVIEYAERCITEKGLNESSAKMIRKNSVVIAMTGATVAKSAILAIESSANQSVCALEPKSFLDYRFLYYWISNNYIDLKSKALGALTSINLEIIKKYQIPVPPLEVQSEIVQILDKFTLLTAELTAELTARKQQYEYYRDTLLTFDNEIPKVKIKDIATDIYRGSGITRDMVTEEGFPCIRYGEIYTKYNLWFDKCLSHTDIKNVPNPKYFEYGDILFAITGESVEEIAKSVAYVGSEKCIAGGDIVVLKHKQNPKYLSLVLSTNDSIAQKGKGKVKSKVVHSSVPAIGEIIIPLPSLEVQNKLVNVLENFEQICEDLNIGLPAEIEARKQQYEIYRTNLLTMLSEGVNFTSKQAREVDYNFIKIVQYVFGYIYIPFGDLYEIKNGLNKEKEAFGKGTPIINFTDVYNNRYVNKEQIKGLVTISCEEIERYKVINGDILFTRTSETKEDIGMTCAVIDNIDKCVFSGFVLRARPITSLLYPKFISYYLSTYKTRQEIIRYSSFTTRATTTGPKLSLIMIPIPSMNEQKKIIDKLDKFEIYCNSINEGLPKEIKLRQKQFEYYRNKLMKF